MGGEEVIEVSLVVLLEGVAAAQEQEPGAEHVGVECGFDAGGFSALQISAHQGEPGGEPSHDMELVQHVAGVSEMLVDGCLVGL